MNTQWIFRACALIALTGAQAAWAAAFTVEMKDKKFAMSTLKIKVGDTVSFKNMDSVNHNVFSLSDAKTFDLGSFPKGQSRVVTMDKPGVVEVECVTHPDMKLTINVAK